jgi:hypothetical protein
VTIWVVGAAAAWVVGACGLALLLGSVLRRGGGPADPRPAARGGALAVAVPVQRTAPPSTPPHGMRSRAHFSCAAPRAVR